jgi:2-polyprenyl-3-methyl-5-hydroxy-6-metoxy-1,4-benzoquinol methylase
LGDSWVLVRRCTDRFEKMKRFLEKHGLMPPQDKAYLDIGCSYGWFVREMDRLSFEAYGVEIDWAAVEIGRRVYGLKPSRVTRSEVVRFLKGHQRSYDIVSCFSLIHHFVMGRGSISAEEMLKLIEKVTRTVLFFETGETHEAWFRDSLSDWNADYVERWLATNSGFTKIYRLGTDCDNVPPFTDNYGRTLFACMRY